MLRAQRTNSDRAPTGHRLHLHPQQHVALAPRPLFHGDAPSMSGGDASMMVILPLDDGSQCYDDSVSQLCPQHHQQPQLHHVNHHQHYLSNNADQQHVRLSHSAKARKIKSAGASSTHSMVSTPSSLSSSSGSNGTSGGRKVLKQEVTQLQQLVDGMQHQVNAATREIQELRNMVGLMVNETAAAQQQQQQYHQQQPLRESHPPFYQQQQTPSCADTPLMDIYQQNSFSFVPEELLAAQQSDLTDHFGYEATDGKGGEDVQSAFYCRMEQALLCDDDDFPLFFQG